jgi:hypothetical protein
MGALGQREEFCKGETGVGEMAQTAIGTGNNFLCPLVWTSASVSTQDVIKKTHNNNSTHRQALLRQAI